MKPETSVIQRIKLWWKRLTAPSCVKIKVGGISLKGLYHDVNQDAYSCVSCPAGVVLALSDGVGSCSLSHFGSHALCEAVVEESFAALCDIGEPKEFLQRVHARWLKKLSGMPVEECACTALFVVVKDRHFTAFQLGDGVVVVMTDDISTVLLEDKEEDFQNITDAMDEKLRPDLWRIVSRDFEYFRGIYMSSDGVGLDQYTESRYADFAKCLFEEYQPCPVEEIEQAIGTWLKDWDGSDDKTITFALRDEGERDEHKNGDGSA